MKLFVAGLPSDFDDVDFKEMFELYGTVLSAKIIVDHNTKKSKGFGFLDMPIDSEAQSVISTLNGVKMSGKPIVIKEATEQAQRPSTGGGFRPQRNDGPRPRFNNNRDNNGGGYNRDNNGGGYNRDNRGGGYSRDNNGGGYNRDNRGGGYSRDNNGGGYNRDNRGGGYNRDNNGGGYNRDYNRDRDYNKDNSSDKGY